MTQDIETEPSTNNGSPHISHLIQFSHLKTEFFFFYQKWSYFCEFNTQWICNQNQTSVCLTSNPKQISIDHSSAIKPVRGFKDLFSFSFFFCTIDLFHFLPLNLRHSHNSWFTNRIKCSLNQIIKRKTFISKFKKKIDTKPIPYHF